MKFSNIFEKLENIYNLVINSDILLILLLLIIAVIILRLFNLINNKKMNISIFSIELLFIIISIYQNNDYMLNIGNSLIDNIFMNFYFPSIYVYLFIVISSISIFICTSLNRFISKTYKVITNIYFYIFSFLNILLLNVIAVNKIDIFAKESLFTNNNTLILLELSTLIFFIYLITNALIYITNSITLLVDSKVNIKNKELVKDNINIDNNLVIDLPKEISPEIKLQPEYNNKLSFNELVNKLETKDKEIDLVPELNKTKTVIDLVPEVQPRYKFIDPQILEEDLFENTEIKEKVNFIDFNIVEKEDNLTLKDYKLFSNMLKTVIETNNTNNLSLSDILNNNLLNKYSKEEYSKFEKILNSCLN